MQIQQQFWEYFFMYYLVKGRFFFAGVPGKVRWKPPGNHQLPHGKSACSPECPHMLHFSGLIDSTMISSNIKASRGTYIPFTTTQRVKLSWTVCVCESCCVDSTWISSFTHHRLSVCLSRCNCQYTVPVRQSCITSQTVPQRAKMAKKDTLCLSKTTLY